MSAAERRKGASGELEVVHLLHSYGWPSARRTSDGREQRLRGDIAGGPSGVHFEVRRRERVNVWACYEQAVSDLEHPGVIPVVAFRRSRSPWLAVIELPELLELLKLREVVA